MPETRNMVATKWPDERIDDLAQTVRDMTPLVSQVARHDAMIDEVRKRLDGIDEALTNLDERLTRRIEDEAEAQAAFRREYRKNREEDQRIQEERAAKARKDRGILIVSLVTAFVPVFVAIIYVAAHLLSNGAVEVPQP